MPCHLYELGICGDSALVSGTSSGYKAFQVRDLYAQKDISEDLAQTHAFEQNHQSRHNLWRT